MCEQIVRNVISNSGPRVFVSTVPKSGTHLIDSILAMLPNMSRKEKLGINANLRFHPLNYVPFVSRETCTVGIGRPQTVKLAVFRNALSRIKPWQYGLGQLPYQTNVMNEIHRQGVIPIVVIRDPRDIVISLMHHIMTRKRHFLHTKLVTQKNDKERIMSLITGISSERGEFQNGIREKIELISGWLDDPHVFKVRFEDLIGSQGGQSDEHQAYMIQSLAAHISISISSSEAARIGRDMFGKGRTFRKGQTSTWEEYMDDEVLHSFRREVGSLIEKMGYEY